MSFHYHSELVIFITFNDVFRLGHPFLANKRPTMSISTYSRQYKKSFQFRYLPFLQIREFWDPRSIISIKWGLGTAFWMFSKIMYLSSWVFSDY